MSIFKVLVKKSKSKNFDAAINIMKKFEQFELKDNQYSITVDNKFEYIEKYRYIDQLFYLVRNWKDTEIYLNEKKFEKYLIYYRMFEEEIYQSIYNEITNYDFKNKEVGFDTLSLNENVPAYITYYPPLYGTIFAFKNSFTDIPYICSCNKVLIEKMKYDAHFIENNLPLILSEWLSKNDIENIEYKTNICFKCNKTLPKFDYCHEMYGGKFKRKYGWFINKMLYEDSDYNRDLYPGEDRFRHYENLLRVELGVPKIGEGWINETIMFNMVEKLFENYECERHFRPQWLEGLEIDIYIPELKIGFEYNGIQHYKAVKHWGGEEQLIKQRKNDKRKKAICKKNDVELIVIKYNEDLSEDLLINRIPEKFFL